MFCVLVIGGVPMETLAKSKDSVGQIIAHGIFGLLAGLCMGWLWWQVLFSLNITLWYTRYVGEASAVFEVVVNHQNQLRPFDHVAENWGFRIALFLWLIGYVWLIYSVIV
jgi:hypothetical protein